MIKAEVLLLREPWSWMSKVSGFDPFALAVESLPNIATKSIWVPIANCPPETPLSIRILQKVYRTNSTLPPEHRSPSPFTERRHELVAPSLLAAMSETPERIAILTAGENQYGSILSTANISIKRRLVICFHQPASWWRLHWRNYNCLNNLKGIICVSEEQQNYIQSKTLTPTFLLRHGVDLNFFTPGKHSQDSKIRLLFVGHWLRDFNLLESAMTIIWQRYPNILLDMVIPFHARNDSVLIRLARNQNVHWHANLSPEDLRNLYQQASLLFLPLIDSTANNGIVEALACGLPIVSTKVGGVMDYVSDQCGMLCSMDNPQDHADAVIEMIENPELLNSKRIFCRQHAIDTLDWNKSAKSLFHQLLNS